MLSLIALAAAVLYLGGCAVPGEPTARHPITPQPIADLAVHQQGDAAILTFTLPTQSTDKEALTSTPTVEVYRAAAQPAGVPAKSPAHPTDTIPGRTVDMYKKNGHIEFPDPLDPAELARHPGQQTTFTVRTRLTAKRASADSNAVTLPLYPAPGPVRELRASLSEQAIDLTWTAPELSAGRQPVYAYRVYREEVPPPGSSAAAGTAAASSAQPQAPSLQFLAQVMQPEYRDTSFQLDHAYSYVVRSIAQFGSSLIESADATLAVYAKDVFPPAAPQGLQAVVMPAAAGEPISVELVWGISPESDLAGYNVYRGEQPGAPGTKLTPEPLGSPTYRDMAVMPGTRYYYHVTAVDRDGNESPASGEVQATVPPQ